MSRYSDLKVERDVARATAARFVKEAAAHLVSSHEPHFEEENRAKAADARALAKKWAARADLFTSKLSELISRTEPSE